MDNYEELKIIGKGGYGDVHLVFQTNTKQVLAMKKVPLAQGQDNDDRKGAHKEVAVLVKLKHPNIVSYIESFEAKDHLHIVTAFYAGGDLWQKIEQKKKENQGVLTSFTRDEIFNILRQLCQALEYVHKQHIIHRDIKPRNIFFADEKTVKLGDFGIAKVLNSSLDFANTAIGTFQFSAPEIFAGQPYNNKCDMWSLGCVLYELVTMKKPFEENNYLTLISKISNVTYEPLPTYVESDLRNLIVDLIQKEESIRPTATEVLNKLVCTAGTARMHLTPLMATVTETSVKRVQMKLEELEEQKRSLYIALDIYVDKVMTAGKKWAESEDDEQRPTFMEISQTIGNAVDFIYLTHSEFSASAENFQSGTDTYVKTVVGTTRSSAMSKVPNLGKIQEKKIEENEEQIKRLAAQLDQMQNLKLELHDLKKHVNKLSENQDQLQDEVSSRINQNQLQDEISSRINEDIEKKFTLINKDMTFFKKSVSSELYRNNESVLETLLLRTQLLEKDANVLTNKMIANQKSLENVVIKVEHIAMDVENIQGRLAMVETEKVKYPQVVEKQLEEVHTNYTILWQMFKNRLRPLEKLRRILNDKSKVRDENATKLQKVENEITAMSPRISALEMQPSRLVVGFTAAAKELHTMARNSVITNYGVVYYNEGDHFDKISGEFTAPVGGVYVISIIIMCHQRHCLKVQVSCITAPDPYVCSLQNNTNYLHTCNFCLYKMNNGDKLLAKIMNQNGDNNTRAKIKFSCFLIG